MRKHNLQFVPPRTENDARGTCLLESYVACHYVATEVQLSTKPPHCICHLTAIHVRFPDNETRAEPCDMFEKQKDNEKGKYYTC